MADNASSGSKTGLIIGVVGGLVVLLLVAAVMFGNEEVGAEYGEPTIEGTSLPPFPGTESVDLSATGLPAPEVFGKNFDGQDVSITNDGRAKGIVLVAHWCPHCQEEVPRVQEWLDTGGGVDGVDLYSISTAANSGRPNYPASEWLDSEGWTVPTIVDDQAFSIHDAYGSGGFPYWVFLNADGTVAVRTAGQLSIAQLEEVLNTLEQ
ncbi:MAG: TlpA disulfide reductase family protein [Actinomycetota bacterium]